MPAGYSMTSTGGLKVVVKEGYAESFDGFTLPKISASGGGESAGGGGRARLTPMSLVGNPGKRALVRRCVRGGIPGLFLKEFYLGGSNPRPLRELKVSEHARVRGVPTPEVLAAIFQQISPFFYRGALAVREISSGVDLEAALATLGRPADRDRLVRKRRVIALLGRLVAKMHAAGIWHADLHLSNVLLTEDEGEPELFLLDLDRAKVFDRLPDFRKRSNILRLYRSVRKVNRRHNAITRTDLLRFLRSYAGGTSQPARQSARELARRLGRMLPAWRLKWKLSDALGI